MNVWVRRMAWPAGVATTAIVVGIFGLDAARTQVSTIGWLAGAVTAVALVHYRASRDPDVLLMAAAGGVLAFQSALATVVINQLEEADLALRTVPITAALIGWAVAGVCLALASPWWERRGRPQIAASTLGGGILAIVVVADALLLAFPPQVSGEIDAAPGYAIPPIGWVWLVVAALAWTLVLIRRTFLVGRGSHHGAVAGTALASLFLLASWAVLARSGDPFAEPFWTGVSVWMSPVSVASLLVAVLLMQRADASRMRRSTDRADQILEGRAEIASMIAHEVRGPVTTIRGIASTASTHYQGLSDEERREFFDLIEQESRRLLSAVDQTSLALKIDAGSLTYQKAPAPLATIVRAGVEAAGVPADLHAVHVLAQEDVSLVADASRLTEMVRQLVENAGKYSPPGTPIIVRGVADGDVALIEVIDEGPGIPDDQREAVFTRFTRWRPRGYEEQPGNGLGLFICRGLAAEHRGKITVEDGQAGGTMLRVRLPLEGV